MDYLRYFEILATIAGVAMSVANYPQAFKIYKTKSASDISLITYSILVAGSFIWLVYGIYIRNWPIIISYLFGLLAVFLVLLGIIKYSQKRI